MSKYRLLKDLPHAKAGFVYVLNEGGTEYICYDLLSKNSWDVTYPKQYVEGNPEWFEKVSDRIEVHVFPGGGTDCKNGFFAYTYTASTIIKESKLLAIKKAIEFVVNDEPNSWHDIQVKEAMEKAFNAARALDNGQKIPGYRGCGFLYPKFDDFISRIKR